LSGLAETPGAQPNPVRLGEVLIAQGLITSEQLEIALADQQVSGNLLGAILIERGFAASTTIAAALATQYGGLLKTEYGFATGFGPAPAQPVAASQPAESQPEESEVVPLRLTPQSFEDAPTPVAQPEPVLFQPAPPPAEDPRVAELARERDELAAAVVDAADQVETLAAENAGLSAQIAEDRVQAAQPPVEDPRLADLAQERDELAAAVVDAADRVETLSAENARLSAQIAEDRERWGAEIERYTAESKLLAGQLAELTAERDAALAAPQTGADGLAGRVAELESVLARVTNRSSTISERLDEVIGDVSRLHDRLDGAATAPTAPFHDEFARPSPDRAWEPAA
jgi:DNA repair exonuclease SbcCD ATPase subunit